MQEYSLLDQLSYTLISSSAMKIEDDANYESYCFFLFVNTSSGSNQGYLLLRQEVERIQFVLTADDETELTYRCNVFIYNMRTDREYGFKRLKEHSEIKKYKCFTIVCGGDGTVMWVINEMIKAQINIALMPIGIIPLGTGNDFSRELGWGYETQNLLDNGFKNLKILIKRWLKAKEQYFDIWDVEAEVYDNGKFEKVQGANNSLIDGHKFSKTFCNYFSFGIDGKIGYSFDMHRKKSRIGNLATYACMGIIKTMTRTKNLDELLDSFELKNKKFADKKMSNSISTQPFNFEQSKQSIIVRGSSFSQQQPNEKSLLFEKNYYNILMLNINSYTGGVCGIWDNAKDGFIKHSERNQQYQQISTGDGKLEVVSFGSSFGIAIQRMIGGFSKRVAQGQGPFVFNFHRYQNRPKHRTYLQIDGQFVRFTNPKKLVVKHSQLVPKGKIKVLRNVKNNAH